MSSRPASSTGKKRKGVAKGSAGGGIVDSDEENRCSSSNGKGEVST